MFKNSKNLFVNLRILLVVTFFIIEKSVARNKEKVHIEARNDQFSQYINKGISQNQNAWSSSSNVGSGSVSATPLKVKGKDTSHQVSPAASIFKAKSKFKTISDELKWKFNKARESLKEAKQYVALAELSAAKKHRSTMNENEVKKIITKTEVALVHAGDKMGLDYVHYKRSIDDDNE